MMIKDEVVIVNGQDTGEGKWSQHPELQRKVTFAKSNESYIWCRAIVDGSDWKVLMNDFPDRPLFTIYIDEIPVMSFNDWPHEIWSLEESK